MLEYLRIMEHKLIDIFSGRTITIKINKVNYKGYVHDELKKELNSGDTRCTETIRDFLKFKRLKRIKTEETKLLESDEEQILELRFMSP